MPLVFAQAQIHQRDIRQMPLEFGDGFLSRGGRRDDGDVGFTRQDEGDSFSDDSMVVHAQESKRAIGHMAAGRLFLTWPAGGITASIKITRPAALVTVKVPPSSSARSRIVVTPS